MKSFNDTFPRSNRTEHISISLQMSSVKNDLLISAFLRLKDLIQQII